MGWMPCGRGCIPPDWALCGTCAGGEQFYLPPTLHALLSIAGGNCPCVNELNGLAIVLTQTSHGLNPGWESNSPGGTWLGYIFHLCTNRTLVGTPSYPGNYDTAYYLSIGCVTGGVQVGLTSFSADAAVPNGYGCATAGPFNVTIPYASIDCTAPVLTLTTGPLQPFPYPGTPNCPCMGRALTMTVTH